MSIYKGTLIFKILPTRLPDNKNSRHVFLLTLMAINYLAERPSPEHMFKETLCQNVHIEAIFNKMINFSVNILLFAMK